MIKTLRYILKHPVSGQRPMAALARYFRWQLGSRMLNCPIAVPFLEKTFLVAERSMTGATGNIYCGLHEFHDMAFLLHFLRDEDLFIDIGANIGSYTVLAAGVIGCEAVSFEPVPVTFGKLQRNVLFNLLADRVRLERCAVGAQTGTIRFSIDCDTMNHVVAADYPGSSQPVPLKRLDDFPELSKASMWKVDVEGFEQDVLTGAETSLRRASLKAVLLEGDSETIEEKMHGAGFEKAFYEPFQRQLKRKQAVMETRQSVHNNLWIRTDSFDWVHRRCQQARIFEIHGCRF